MEVGVKVMGEDGLSATGGTGVPEKFGFLAYLQIGSDLLGAIVLDDDFVVGGEMVLDIEAIGEADGERGDELMRDGFELLEYAVLVAGADTEEEIRLVKEREAKSMVVDTGGELVLPGEDVGDTEAGAFGLALEKSDLFGQGQGDPFVPVFTEILQEVTGLGTTQEKSGDDPFVGGHRPDGMAESVVAIDEGTEELAVARAHLFVVAEEAFQPGMQGHFALVGVDDGGRMAELVIEFHFL